MDLVASRQRLKQAKARARALTNAEQKAVNSAIMSAGILSRWAIKRARRVSEGSSQPLDATLTALAALDDTAGLLEQIGADTFSRRALGVAAGTSVPTRSDADTRYAAASHTHTISQITNLTNSLDTNGGLTDRSATATQIADKTHAVNTTGKRAGLNLWDTTNTRLMIAAGSTDVSAWWVADGSASVTPA